MYNNVSLIACHCKNNVSINLKTFGNDTGIVWNVTYCIVLCCLFAVWSAVITVWAQMSLFQQPYNHQFPHLGPKNATSPVPQHKGPYMKNKTTKPFDHLPNIWLFGQGVLRHDGNNWRVRTYEQTPMFVHHHYADCGNPGGHKTLFLFTNYELKVTCGSFKLKPFVCAI